MPHDAANVTNREAAKDWGLGPPMRTSSGRARKPEKSDAVPLRLISDWLYRRNSGCPH
jgi:hypothetical protein